MPEVSTGTAVSNNLYIATRWVTNDTATMTITGGTINIGTTVYIGEDSDNDGTLTISGGVLNAGTSVRVGVSGEGTINMAGGTIDTGTFYVPSTASGDGVVQLSGGEINADTLSMNSNGYINITGTGKIVLSGDDMSTIATYINNGYIKAYNGMGKVDNEYDSSTNRTIVQAVKTQVGAIFWGGWHLNNEWDDNLRNAEYHDRLPFYTWWFLDWPIVYGDNKTILEDQIEYASDAGLDYFAHLYYHPIEDESSLNFKYNYGLKYHLLSDNKDKMNFCLILEGPHLGEENDWSDTVDYIVQNIMCEEINNQIVLRSNYQTVLNGRPLIYMHAVEDFRTMFQCWEENLGNCEAALDELRYEFIAAGMEDPYIVCMVSKNDFDDGRWYVDNLGFDAISSYAPTQNPGLNTNHAYSELTDQCESFWNDCKNENKDVIPTCMVGWDPRPRMHLTQLGYHVNHYFYQPTMTELKNHIKAGIQWNLDYPNTARANAVLIYALNEYDEGGWLDPDESEDTERLDALYEAIFGID